MLEKAGKVLGEKKPLGEASKMNYYRFIVVLKLQTALESPAADWCDLPRQ